MRLNRSPRLFKNSENYWLQTGVTYFSVFWFIFLSLWNLIEPLSVGLELKIGNSYEIDRRLVHIGISFLISSHITLALQIQKLVSTKGVVSQLRQDLRHFAQNPDQESTASDVATLIQQGFEAQEAKIRGIASSAARTNDAQHHELMSRINQLCSGIYLLMEDEMTREEIVALYHKAESMISDASYLTPEAKRDDIKFMISVAVSDKNFRPNQQKAVIDWAKQIGLPKTEIMEMINDALERTGHS